MPESDRIILIDGVTYVSEEDYRVVSDLHMEALRDWQKDRTELEVLRKEVTRLHRIERRATNRWREEYKQEKERAE